VPRHSVPWPRTPRVAQTVSDQRLKIVAAPLGTWESLAAPDKASQNPSMIDLRAVDRGAVHAAFTEAFADYAMTSTGLTEERLLLRMEKNAVDYDLSVGAYDDDRMVGFTLIGVDSWGGAVTAYDAGTGIVPAFRGQGLARRMFDRALPALRDRGVERFSLEVLQQNEPAIRAYKKSGFEITRQLRSYATDAAILSPNATSVAAAWDVQPIGARTFALVVQDADWLPSFENRFSAVTRIPNDVTLVGVFDGGRCVGVAAYSPPLRWLLSLVVCRSHRRRGVGHALLARVAARLPEGVTSLAVINVDASDEGMIAFVGALGFSPLVDQFEMARRIA
jgi:ribosomal protein S18 acetylase RimI-like enzyme